MEQPHVIRPDRSPELNELFAALAKAQAEMDSAGLNSNNPFFKSKYASLEDLVVASRPSLTKNGLSVTQIIRKDDDGQSVLSTVLGHSSGQWIESCMSLNPAKPDVQSLGSYISYLKRYLYAAIVGVMTSDESDDDGESERKYVAQASPRPQSPPAKYGELKPEEKITKEQEEEIRYAVDGYPKIAEEIFKAYNVTKLSDLPKSKYRNILNKILENINAEGKK